MDTKKIYRRLSRRIENMNSYEKTRLFAIIGMSIFITLILIGLIVFFSLRNLNVIIGVDTTGLLGNPSVLINNQSSSTIKNVKVIMDNQYESSIKSIKPKASAVVYFNTFTPLPPNNYMPKQIMIKSGIGVAKKSISPEQ
ncbi:MAG: hypothetical protein M1381_12165 [Deltaproteobacteria bacterium]|nr:hypothetical protein [Deltaproteobacteria bacterium]MCL5792432.1 hypothetical protein [Deltaproteobacteria bacterium]